MQVSARTRRAVSALGALVMTLLLAAPVAAGGAPPDTATGDYGVHGFESDTPTDQGGRCRYGYQFNGSYYNGLRVIGVHPVIAGRSLSRTTQRIGYRAIFQAFNGSTWDVVATSAWSFDTATVDAHARFGTRVYRLPQTGPDSYGGHRVKVKLRWYGRDDDTVRGRATLYPDFYRATENGIEHTQIGACGNTTG
jgi:hypothetical protein